jgi:hypothetical protein
MGAEEENGMKEDEDASEPSEGLADMDLDYRGRGRPRLPPEQRRREKLVVSITPEEKRRIMVAAAKDREGPLGPQDWARKRLLELAPPVPPEESKP